MRFKKWLLLNSPYTKHLIPIYNLLNLKVFYQENSNHTQWCLISSELTDRQWKRMKLHRCFYGWFYVCPTQWWSWQRWRDPIFYAAWKTLQILLGNMWYLQMWRNTQVSIPLLQAKYKTNDPPLEEIKFEQ